MFVYEVCSSCYGMESLQNFYSILWSIETPIIQRLSNIREFWASNKDFWFSHTPINSWPTEECVYNNTKDMNICLLLHYDQIYRHPNPNIHPRNAELAYKFATQIAFRILHTGQFEACEEWEKVFVLLALRHNKSLPLKEMALHKCLAEAEKTPTSLWMRFLNATIWDIHCFKESKHGYPCESISAPAQRECLRTFDYILEHPKIHAAEVPMQELYETFHKTLCDVKAAKVAVSISGGVDSMVAAVIAKNVCVSLKKDLILLHVCYANRDCCEDECNLLRWFANSLHLPLHIRYITEMKRIRNSSLRTVYENATRKIRFAFYKYFNCPVILGHNQDDCFENVFSNLGKQIHFENLFGMREVGEEQGVQILRPMLEIPKKTIVAFADQNGIPHLCDSTPAWSKRGQMRDTLIPGIQTFDPQILAGLSEFVKHTRFLQEQWDKLFGEWMSNIRPSTSSPIRITRDSFFESNFQNANFWIKVFQSLGIPRPSNKSIRNFTDILIRKQAKRCNLDGTMFAQILHDSICICKY